MRDDAAEPIELPATVLGDPLVGGQWETGGLRTHSTLVPWHPHNNFEPSPPPLNCGSASVGAFCVLGCRPAGTMGRT